MRALLAIMASTTRRELDLQVASVRVLGNLALVMLFCACASDSSLSADIPYPDDAQAEGVRVRFDPGQGGVLAFGAIPWPDDLYINAQSQIELGDVPGPSSALTGYVRAMRDSLRELDGFGIATPIYFFVDGELDADSLPQSAEDSLAQDASAFLIDADTGSPEAFQRVPVELQWSPGLRRLAMRPVLGHPLMPGRRYAALLTSRIRDAVGRRLLPAPKFVSVRDSSAALSDARLREARAQYTPVLETLLAKTELARDEVVAAAVFHVQTAGADLDAARQRVSSAPAPSQLTALDAAGLDGVFGTAAPHDQLLGIIQGWLPMPNYLSAASATHGAFSYHAAQTLAMKGSEDVPFTLFLPKGDQPAPIVLYQHQLGRERSDAVFIANALARRNIAVLAIDAPFHGLRARADGDAGEQGEQDLDVRNRFTGVEVPDGFGDQTGDFYGARDTAGELVPLHPFYVRDALRQGAIDWLSVVRWLSSGDLSGVSALGGVGQRTLDRRRFGFIGEDIGAQMGVMLARTESSVTALALVGAGAFVAQGFVTGASSQALFTQLAGLLGRDAERIDYESDHPRFWPELMLFETLVGRAEPLAYAPSLRRSAINVLLMMADQDETTANSATEALAAALGASLLGVDARYVSELQTQAANSGDMIAGNATVDSTRVTRALTLYGPADHALLLSEQGQHTFVQPVEPPFQALSKPESFDNPQSAALDQLAEYFATYFGCTAATGCVGSATVP